MVVLKLLITIGSFICFYLVFKAVILRLLNEENVTAYYCKLFGFYVSLGVVVFLLIKLYDMLWF